MSPRASTALVAGLLLASACSGTTNPNAHDATSDTLDAVSMDTPPDRDTATADASDATDAFVPADVQPITAPNEQWTWVDIPGTRCADGSQTGIGINLTNQSSNVLIFLEGGGACWDGTTCWGPVMTSFYVGTGYSSVEFATDPQLPIMLPLRRSDTRNPFRFMNLVYIPYCTGDVHAGDNVMTYNYLGTDHVTYHFGYKNLDVILPYLRATFPAATRVWLGGDSAGGFGAALNFQHVQDNFPSARVDVLDDSGQPIQPDPTLWSQWKASWNIHFPPGCTGCSDSIGAFVDYYRMRYPSHRFGLVSFTNDAVITTFMGLTPTQFSDELTALGDHMDMTWPDAHYYFIAGALHVGLATDQLDPGLVTWLQQMVTDDPAWMSYHP